MSGSDEQDEKHVESTQRQSKRHKVPDPITAPCANVSLKERVQLILRDAGDHSSSVMASDSYTKFWVKTCLHQGRKCLLSDVTHQPNSKMVSWIDVSDNGNVHYHCKCSEDRKILGRTYSNEVKFELPDGTFSAYGGRFVGKITSDCPKAWNENLTWLEHNENRVKEYLPNPATKCYVVNAGMGMGKTHQLVRFLKMQIQANANLRVLVVSARISLAHTQIGLLQTQHKLGFACYNDKLLSAKIWDAPRLITTYESLHNLVGKPRFDIIILDECRSLMNNMTCTNTNTGSKLV